MVRKITDEESLPITICVPSMSLVQPVASDWFEWCHIWNWRCLHGNRLSPAKG